MAFFDRMNLSDRLADVVRPIEKPDDLMAPILDLAGDARIVMIGCITMSHLDNIATRQRNSLVRDALFATLVALATVVSISTVTKAASASAAVAHR